MIGDAPKILPQQFDHGVDIQVFSCGSFGLSVKPNAFDAVELLVVHGDPLCNIKISHRKSRLPLLGFVKKKMR